MPLLYRILMRLSAITAGLGLVLGILMAIALSSEAGAGWPLLILLGLVPAGVLYAIAWVVRPSLDRASLRRLWRE